MSDRYDQFLEEIRLHVKLEELIKSDGYKLERVGNALKCLSPLRKEKTPSFWVYADQNSWYDFGTGDGGDTFGYVMKRDKCDFNEAAATLGRFCGIELYWETEPNTEKYDQEIRRKIESRNVIDMLSEATEYYRPLPDRIRKLIHDKYGLTDETIDKFKIGWASGDLWFYFQENGYSDEACLRTGLFVKTSGGLVDFFHNRIYFPYLVHGMTYYAIGRHTEYTPDKEYEKAKYKKLQTHSEKRPYVSVHISNDWFYNEGIVRGELDELIITEGVTDCIAASQHGFNCISPVTVRFRAKDLPKLCKLTERVSVIYIFNDSDILEDGREPGKEGALQTAEALFRAGRDVRIASLPRPDEVKKVDLCDFLRG